MPNDLDDIAGFIKKGESYGLGEAPKPEVLDTGIKDFNETFPRRIDAFLEDVTNGVPLEHLRSSGRISSHIRSSSRIYMCVVYSISSSSFLFS